MKLVTNRIDQISQYLQPYMQECFRESCVRLQEEIDSHAGELWEELARAMEECLNSAVSLQNQGRKGRLVYLVFSVLGHGAYLNGPEIWIEALDDGFYLDRREAKGHYHPRFLQERYTGDLDCLYKKACEKFIRLQDYEWDGIKRNTWDSIVPSCSGCWGAWLDHSWERWQTAVSQQQMISGLFSENIWGKGQSYTKEGGHEIFVDRDGREKQDPIRNQ